MLTCFSRSRVWRAGNPWAVLEGMGYGINGTDTLEGAAMMVEAASTHTMQRVHCSNIPSHRKLKQLFFSFWGGVNFLMQLQFLAPVELFFKQLKGYSF